MYLTVSKRFEFAASHRCYVPDWDQDKNFGFYGKESQGHKGHGHNFITYLVFHGPTDERSGMLINVATIKERTLELLNKRYDHKFLNLDTPPFNRIIPTPENIASHLLTESIPLFESDSAHPVVCHLIEAPDMETTVYLDGCIEKTMCIKFSAARRTFSPHLSESENMKLFGRAAAPSGHGHNYTLRITIRDEINEVTGTGLPYTLVQKILGELYDLVDHRNLNMDLPGYGNVPMTTECLARYIWNYLGDKLPIIRIRIQENDHFFVEHHGEGSFFLGLCKQFRAAHRLHSKLLSDDENHRMYGKCNNFHGHDYGVEATFSGELDEKSGTLYPLDTLYKSISDVLGMWDYKHLNDEIDDFLNLPTTGENIITILWRKLDSRLNADLHRLRLWETPNNRFTLRRFI